MDPEIVSLLLHGCKLAQELESDLPNLGNRPDLVSNFCAQIVQVFSAVWERINNAPGHQQHQSQMNTAADFVQSTTSFVLHHQQQLLLQYYGSVAAESSGARALPETSMPGGGGGGGGGTAEVGVPAMGRQFGASEGSDPAVTRASSSTCAQRPQRRHRDLNRRIVNVEAPRFGNPEAPPEDGFTWKKYGQKEILGFSFPRSYYRCTHQKLFHCPAKKQVQRLDSDPYTFQVTYRGEHTCHMSWTAPSAAPASPLPAMALGTAIGHETKAVRPMQPPAQATTAQLPAAVSRWLSRDFTLGTTAGPSTSTTEEPYPLVAGLATDAMLNSGNSSTTNSMDAIFSSMHRRDDQQCTVLAGMQGDNKDS